MDKIDLEYTIRQIDLIKDIARLGVDSQNNMEQVLFRRIYDDLLMARNSLALKLRIIVTADSKDDATK